MATDSIVMSASQERSHGSEVRGIPPRSRVARTSRWPEPPAPSDWPHRGRLRVDARCVSLLDEAHRRIKDNMQSIERRLRLASGTGDRGTTEAVLTDLQDRLRSAAGLHRALCRAGHFAQVDLAVYLRQVASALSAASGKSRHATPEPAGWAFELPQTSLTWIDDSCEIHAPSPRQAVDLHGALRFVPKERRAIAHRAVCAAAIVVPPSIFRWRSPESTALPCGCHQPVKPGDARVRLRLAEDGVTVELAIADRGLGLPADFEPQRQAALGLQIASLLNRLLREGGTPGSDSHALFGVRFVPAGR